MKREISVSYMRTINFGNFESAKIQAGIAEEIPNSDKRKNEEIFNDLFKECEDFVLEKCEIEIGA